MTSLLDTQARLRSGALSLETLFAQTLARIEADARYKAWVWTYDDPEAALAQRFQSSETPRPLDGLMLGVKDIFNAQTGTTEMGSRSWAGHRAGNDARVLAEFIYRGAVMTGKTAASEFAVHDLPDTLNPWDTTVTAGTSSSGSAVAVALEHVPVALASQTGGSITRPASFTGTIGVKPTQGIYPRTGVLKTCDPFDTIGFIGRHLADIEPVFEATRVRGSNYPFIEDGLQGAYAMARDPGRKIRVALVRTPFSSFEDAAVSKATGDFCARLPKDHFSVGEVDLIRHLARADWLHETIYNKALAYYFQTERASGATFSPVMSEIFAKGDAVTPDEYREALQELPHLRNSVAEAVADIDVLVAPSTATTAPPRGQMEQPDTSRFWTMLHLPTISLPMSIDDTTGLPFGVQIVGSRKFSDPLLFDVLRRAGIDDSALQVLTRT